MADHIDTHKARSELGEALLVADIMARLLGDRKFDMEETRKELEYLNSRLIEHGVNAESAIGGMLQDEEEAKAIQESWNTPLGDSMRRAIS